MKIAVQKSFDGVAGSLNANVFLCAPYCTTMRCPDISPCTQSQVLRPSSIRDTCSHPQIAHSMDRFLSTSIRQRLGTPTHFPPRFCSKNRTFFRTRDIDMSAQSLSPQLQSRLSRAHRFSVRRSFPCELHTDRVVFQHTQRSVRPRSY